MEISDLNGRIVNLVKKTTPIGELMEQGLPNPNKINEGKIKQYTCLLYTSDAADDYLEV